jgi:UDP-2,4-diacetamido-2,4,6-trideoxy-beta-L-altropyranose hydrolase
MRVVIRTDASAAIGTGHVFRCLTLANVLRQQGCDVSFVCRDLPGNMFDFLTSEGFETWRLPYDDKMKASHYADEYAAWLVVSQQADADQTLRKLGQNDCNPDWLIVDHYGLDHEWQERLAAPGRRILAIDDLANRTHAVDMLLDQNLHRQGASRYRELVPSGCHILVGPEYALLRPEFQTVRQYVRHSRRDGHLLVFLGGADPNGDTMKAVEALEQLGDDVTSADVIVGRINPQADEIVARCESLSHVTVHHGVPDIARFMATAALSVGAAGTTTWERCCLGLPSLLVAVAHNQEAIAENVHEFGAAEYLGTSDGVDSTLLADRIRALLQDSTRRMAMSQKASELVDGLGAQRVAREVIGLTVAQGVS